MTPRCLFFSYWQTFGVIINAILSWKTALFNSVMMITSFTCKFSHEQNTTCSVFMRVCEAWQPLLSLQIYSNNQLQMVSLSCQNQFTERSWLLSIVKKFWKTFVFSLHNQLQSFMILFFWILIYLSSRNFQKLGEKAFPITLWFVRLSLWNVKVFLWLQTLLITLTTTFLSPITVALIFLFHYLLTGLLTVS